MRVEATRRGRPPPRHTRGEPSMLEPADCANGVEDSADVPSPEPPLVEGDEIPIDFPVEVRVHPRFERPLQASVREARLLNESPWVRPLGRLVMDVSTQGWRFPTPLDGPPVKREKQPRPFQPESEEDGTR